MSTTTRGGGRGETSKSLTLNPVELAKRRAKKAILTKGRNAACHQREDPTRLNLNELLNSRVTGQ